MTKNNERSLRETKIVETQKEGKQRFIKGHRGTQEV